MGKERLASGFDQGSIYLSTPREGRGLNLYEYDLGFKRQELAGKTILDLGSGFREKFSRELKEAQIDATVISLSPDYDYKSVRDLVTEVHVAGPLKGLNWERRSVAGIGQVLPFKDESFDVVLGEFSVTKY